MERLRKRASHLACALPFLCPLRLWPEAASAGCAPTGSPWSLASSLSASALPSRLPRKGSHDAFCTGRIGLVARSVAGGSGHSSQAEPGLVPAAVQEQRSCATDEAEKAELGQCDGTHAVPSEVPAVKDATGRRQ